MRLKMKWSLVLLAGWVSLVPGLVAGGDEVKISGKEIEITVSKDGSGLLDEVKYKGETVITSGKTGLDPTPGYKARPGRKEKLDVWNAALKKLDVNAPCKITKDESARKHEIYVLENGLFKATIVPMIGGRITRFESKLTGTNFVSSAYEDPQAEVDVNSAGGIWGTFPAKIFKPIIEKETEDEVIVTLFGEEEKGGKRTRSKKKFIVRRGHPGLFVEDDLEAVTGGRSVKPEVMAQFSLGTEPRKEDVYFWVGSRGRALFHPQPSVSRSPFAATDTRLENFAAIYGAREGISMLTVFSGPISSASLDHTWSWKKTSKAYTLELRMGEGLPISPGGRKVDFRTMFVPCFNMDGVAFANRNFAVGIIPESYAVSSRDEEWRFRLSTASFLPKGPDVKVTFQLLDRHEKLVRDLKTVNAESSFLIAKTSEQFCKLGKLTAGEYRIKAGVIEGGKEVKSLLFDFTKLGAGPELTLFRPAAGEDPRFPIAGELEHAKVEIKDVKKTGDSSLSITGTLACGGVSSPFETEVKINPEGDGFDIKHTLTFGSFKPADRIRSAGLVIPLSLGGRYRKVKTVVGGETLNDIWRVDQTDEVSFGWRLSDRYCRWPLWRLGGILQDSPTHYKIWKSAATDVSPMVMLEAAKAPGWGDVNNGKWGVQITIENMPKIAPKAITVDGYNGAAQVYFYPPYVPPLQLAASEDASAPTVADRLGCKAGQAWTNTVKLRFHPGPHHLTFKREVPDEDFRKILQALGTPDMRNHGIAYKPETWVQDVLRSDLTVRVFFHRIGLRRGQATTLCEKFGIPPTENKQEFIEALIKKLKED